MADQFAQDRNMVPDSCAEFEAWADSRKPRSLRSSVTDDYNYPLGNLAFEVWQAATQRQQERIAELEAQVSTLTTALFECREAFPIPEPGAPFEPAWMGAMAEPEGVPEYVKAQVQALSLDAGRLDAIENANAGRHMWIVARGKDSFTVALKSPYGNCITRRTLREAIDAAIAAGKGEA